MKATIVELETSVHQKVQKLLAFEDTLGGAERRMVEEHTATCKQCQEDLQWQRRLRHVHPAAGATPDMEAALGRLLPKLENKPRRTIHWTRWALAAQMLVIAGLALVMVRQPADYHLLGASNAADANMIVMFKPETSDNHLQDVLRRNGARVVGGPTESHAWLLKVAPSKLDAVIVTLRAEPSIQLAEPLQAPK